MHTEPGILRTFGGVLFAVLEGIAAAGSPAMSADPNDHKARPAGEDTRSALVQLGGEPLSAYPETRPAPGGKIDFASATVRAYRAHLSALRSQYRNWLETNVPRARVTGEYDISLNAVTVQLNGATLQQISATPLVKHAEYQNLYHPAFGDRDPALK